MKTLLIGGPGHLNTVDAPPDAQHIDWPSPDGPHRYERRTSMDDSGTTVMAFLVHTDLSEGEAAALIRMQMHPG